MASLLNSAFSSVTSWMMDDNHEEEGNYKFYCDSQKLIEMIVEKATEKDNCVDVEQKEEEREVIASPRHKKCPSPSMMRTSKIQPHHTETDNVLTEKLLRERAESGELGVRVGDGILSLNLITSIADGYDLLIVKVEDASPATLRRLSEIPEHCSSILALCFNCTKEEFDKIENAVKGPSFSWKLLRPLDDQTDCLTDEEFETFLALARAMVVLHVVQAAGF